MPIDFSFVFSFTLGFIDRCFLHVLVWCFSQLIKIFFIAMLYQNIDSTFITSVDYIESRRLFWKHSIISSSDPGGKYKAQFVEWSKNQIFSEFLLNLVFWNISTDCYRHVGNVVISKIIVLGCINSYRQTGTTYQCQNNAQKQCYTIFSNHIHFWCKLSKKQTYKITQ